MTKKLRRVYLTIKDYVSDYYIMQITKRAEISLIFSPFSIILNSYWEEQY